MGKHPTFEQGPVCYVPHPDRPWEMILTVNHCYSESDYPETGSVQEYITGHCEATLSGILCEQICNGLLKPGKGTYKVPQPDHVGASSAYISEVYFTQESETVILVEAVFITTLNLYADLGEMTIIDQRDEWFSICGTWDLSDENNILPDWGQFSVYKKKNRAKERMLDEYLVPVMDKHARHLETTRMLRSFYPEALAQSIQLNPRTLAARMGLDIRYLSLADKDAYLAMLFCRDSEVNVIDRETGEILPVPVKKNTIVLNAQTVGKNERCKAARAIIHECMHRFSHRLFWLFQRLYSEEIAYFTCAVDVEKAFGYPRDPLRWLEIQADALTRAAQIPADTVQRAVESRVAYYANAQRYENRASVMRRVIRDLSEVYVVSKKQMRKRLMELGYEDALGAYDWVDGKYVPPYCFRPGSLGKDQTYTISIVDAVSAYLTCEAFRRRVVNGEFLYIEGHFCVNAERYISNSSQGVALTDYARSHMDECCLRFNLVYHNQPHQYEQGVLHQEVRAVGKEYVFDTADSAAMKKALEEAREAMRIRTDIRKLPESFGDTLFVHMKRRGMSVERLAEASGLSDTTIKKYRGNKVSGISTRIVLLLCFAMHLEPRYSEDLIDKAGLSLRMDDDDAVLEFMMNSLYKSSVDSCDAFLVAAKRKPLSKDYPAT